MRRIMLVMLAAMLLVSFSFAMAQEKEPKAGEPSQSPTMSPGSMPGGMPSQPPAMGQGSMTAPQLMQQMQDTMQQMQGMMRKPKMTTAEMKQLQDMLNSLTGHKVLSTLHTNTAIDSIYRLNDLGIGFSHIANSILAVISQRLVRKLLPVL